MNAILLVAIALVIVLFFTPLPRLVLAALFSRAIGDAALARTADRIHLEPADATTLDNAAPVAAIAREFESAGFVSAGTFRIPELQGMGIQLLADSANGLYASVYDHPVAGVFYEAWSRYDDGGSVTHTTKGPTGIQPRENARVVNLPGVSPSVIAEAARRERRITGQRPARVENAVRDLEEAYAEYVAWLKGRGISRREVVEVAARRAA